MCVTHSRPFDVIDQPPSYLILILNVVEGQGGAEVIN